MFIANYEKISGQTFRASSPMTAGYSNLTTKSKVLEKLFLLLEGQTAVSMICVNVLILASCQLRLMHAHTNTNTHMPSADV